MSANQKSKTQAVESETPACGDTPQSEKLESLTTMATGIAHDFNNVLAAILGNINIIMRGLPADSPLMKHAHQIETTALRALELTNQLLAYTGKGDFSVEPLNLAEMILEILPELKASVPANIVLNCNMPNSLPMIQGDASRIRQVIMNLVGNASDAILEKHGTITISCGTMKSDNVVRDDVCLDEIPRGNNYVFVEIRDTGCGMTQKTKAKILDPFFTTKIRGRGMGLSVVLGTVRAHGGDILVNSEQGKGTSLRIIFPAINPRG